MEIFNVYKNITSLIKETVLNSRREGLIIGVSGGLDSSVALSLCCQSIGSDKVLAVFFYESDFETLDGNLDFKDINKLIDSLNVELISIDLSPIIKSIKCKIHNSIYKLKYKNTDYSQRFSSDTKLYDGNLKSRLRMSILYYFSNSFNWLVVGTKNKTEFLTGYYTKYGDGASDFDPLLNSYKTDIIILAEYLKIPSSIIMKIPSAGFWIGQKDEDYFGISYKKLDLLLKLLCDEHKNKNEIIKKVDITKNKYNELLYKIESNRHK